MLTRTHRKTVIFHGPFSLEGIGRLLPAGSYEIVTDEELIEGLSFPVYRRIATMMLGWARLRPRFQKLANLGQPCFSTGHV